ncbi:hypothetical protein RA0C_0500 [Riemerella anatipestifer ATCC 11845 = DSM 15868]|uniref:Uncharacterized protein n=1 Tax=Riemerella anatipestifer (strain ATCC 11845 / DSM 15868 / JCM 9532 / NCTC 11014) TaxID=693978 RepID=H8MDC9_RIEAD|nr:hypothetical protein RA0C_0500 [Riemerella anatipestifer ATCC 11845 = DSM 15868]
MLLSVFAFSFLEHATETNPDAKAIINIFFIKLNIKLHYSTKIIIFNRF